jgi:hypothetical protein
LLSLRNSTVLCFYGMPIQFARWCRDFSRASCNLNLGNDNDSASDPGLVRQLLELAQDAPGYSTVLNGRFKGGYITRTYGRPADRVHAVQPEQSQATSMEENPPFRFVKIWRNRYVLSCSTSLRRCLRGTQPGKATRYWSNALPSPPDSTGSHRSGRPVRPGFQYPISRIPPSFRPSVSRAYRPCQGPVRHYA